MKEKELQTAGNDKEKEKEKEDENSEDENKNDKNKNDNKNTENESNKIERVFIDIESIIKYLVLIVTTYNKNQRHMAEQAIGSIAAIARGANTIQTLQNVI